MDTRLFAQLPVSKIDQYQPVGGGDINEATD